MTDVQLVCWLQDIDPHLLLLIFLPIIGFSAAIGQEPHLLRKNWGQVRGMFAQSRNAQRQQQQQWQQPSGRSRTCCLKTGDR
jgi:hypothetical protein